MSYGAYKVLHLFAVILTFSILGGLALHAANGGDAGSNRQRKLTGALHGMGLVLILVSGFGTVARLGLGLSGWVWGKLAIWLVLGAAAMAFKRAPGLATALLWLLPVLGGVAAWLAVYKPF
ncbi:MAG: hypothetical protein OES32_09415 [Acidobacteriota bacterium]|nr:hypothetical protein [Acidobacteriota bacterium]MDH3523791.1 hypothetical protein [Acidobacteriota bacterium]